MERTKWENISVKNKIQYSLAIMFGVASIIIGYLSGDIEDGTITLDTVDKVLY